tara:strand:+ start:1987 stop:2133 length:147 start_codon:yes stop_codon:yes gene_type:complete
MVFIESMACGAPVIGARSGGPVDFVTNEVGEILDSKKWNGEIAVGEEC